MFTATNYGYGEDFVMTPIKCPPPKIVAVKRSLKRKSNIKANIMDDEDDFINEEENFSDNDDKNRDNVQDLIEFEKEEPLIDLSDESANVLPQSAIQDTVKDKNAKNSSSTITMLLDLLEIGSIITGSNTYGRKSETESVGSCAKDDDCDTLPSLSQGKKSSLPSSSLIVLPLEEPGACAHNSAGKTDNLSSFPSSLPPPLSAIQPENPSIVKNYLNLGEKSEKSVQKEAIKLREREHNRSELKLRGIDENFIDSTELQDSKEKPSIFQSPSVVASSKYSCCCCSSPLSVCSCSESAAESLINKEDNDSVKKLTFVDKSSSVVDDDDDDVHQHIEKKSSAQVVNVNVIESKETSDNNNNRESVCNQNSLNDSLVYLSKASKDINFLSFLSPNTSQRKLPPKFYSSTNSLNRDSCFEASSRLKRLEERFKGFSYTKKLLRSSKVFSKSEEILSTYGKDTEFKSLTFSANNTNSLNSSSLLQLPLTKSTSSLSSSTFTENCLRQLEDLQFKSKSDGE
jgi:hypothetical protein